MTDLERALQLLHALSGEYTDCVDQAQTLTNAIAAARREGEEQASGEIRALRKALHDETMKRLASAAEMRERAAAACHERSQWAASKITNENADAMWATYSNACDDCVYFIAALPLTPEEPR